MSLINVSSVCRSNKACDLREPEPNCLHRKSNTTEKTPNVSFYSFNPQRLDPAAATSAALEVGACCKPHIRETHEISLNVNSTHYRSLSQRLNSAEMLLESCRGGTAGAASLRPLPAPYYQAACGDLHVDLMLSFPQIYMESHPLPPPSFILLVVGVKSAEWLQRGWSEAGGGDSCCSYYCCCCRPPRLYV